MLKRTKVIFIIFVLSAFLVLEQPVYSSVDHGSDSSNFNLGVAALMLTPLVVGAIVNNLRGSTTTSNDSNPVILSSSNYNLLYMTNGASGESNTGKIYILNNSDYAAERGFSLTTVSGSGINIGQDSTCLQGVDANATCYFNVTYQPATTGTTDSITRSTATFQVSATNGTTDTVTVNTNQVPFVYLFDPTIEATAASGIDATSSVYSFATLTKNGQSFIYAATDTGVYKSSDNGATWLAVNGQTNNTLKDERVNALKTIGNIIYAGTEANGVFKSDDGGATWKNITGGASFVKVNALEVIDNKLYAGTPVGVFEFDVTPQGTGWILCGERASKALSLLNIKGILYAGFEGPGTMKYNSSTWTWENISIGTDIKHPVVLCVVGNYLYAGDEKSGREGVWGLNLNEGSHRWEQFGTGISDIVIYALDYVDDNLYAGTQGQGVYKIDPSVGGAWTPVNSGIRNAQAKVNALYTTTDADNKTWMFAGLFGNFDLQGTNSYAGGIYKTAISETTESWSFISHALTNKSVRALVETSTRDIYAGTFGDGVFQSINGGATWVPLSNSGLGSLKINTLQILDGYLYAGVDNSSHTGTNNVNAVFRFKISDSDTTTWELVSNGFNSSYCGTEGACILSSKALVPYDDNIVTGLKNSNQDYKSGVFKFSTAAENWSSVGIFNQIVHGYTNALSSAIRNEDEFLFASLYLNGDSDNGVYKSNYPLTAGNWQRLDAGGAVSNNVLSLIYDTSSGYLYAGGDENGGADFISRIKPFVSGSTWSPYVEQVPLSSANVFCLHSSNIYVGLSSNGVYYSDGEDQTSWTKIKNEGTIGSVFTLLSSVKILYAGSSGGILKMIDNLIF